MPLTSVHRKIAKILLWLIFALLLLVALLLAVLRFSPQLYLGLVNKTTPYTLKASEVRSELRPVSLNFTDLKVDYAAAGKPSATIATAANFYARLDWLGFLSDNINYWYAEISDAEINIAPITTQPQTNTTSSETEAAPKNIHRLLSVLNMQVSNTDIVFGENSRLTITQLNTDIGKQAKQRASDITQNIQLSLNYQQQQKSLSLAGSLSSEYRNGVSNIQVNLGAIDLTRLSEAGGEKNLSAQPIDWAWMKQIEPISLTLNIEQLKYADGLANSLELRSNINQSIDIETLSGELKWPISDSLWMQDRIVLEGSFTPQKNQLIDTKLMLKASQSEWQLDGNIDITQPFNSAANLKFDANSLPLLNEKLEPSALLSEYSQWLPVSSQLRFSPLLEDSSSNGVNINLEKLTAGKSDASGSLRIADFYKTAKKEAPINIQGKLASKKLHYQSEQDSPISKADEASKKANLNTPLFSEKPLDWSWLSAALINLKLDVETLRVDERQFNNVSLPFSLGKQGLQIDGASAELGDGTINTSLTVAPINTESVVFELNTRASGIVLNDLKLVDEKTLKGGDSKLDLTLTSAGASAHELASKLDGNALFHLKKATIGNDAFELIGSDLIAELISKLNPFLKSDPSTDLKCAVVNLNIEQGQIKVNKSIAMETSKMIIVADGKINLDKETINLEIAPQSTGGIGLDASSLVKFLELGGTLSNPKPKVGADGLLKSGVAVGAAISTGGASLLLDGLVSKIGSGKACERALKPTTKKPAK